MSDVAAADTLPYNPGSAIGMALEMRLTRAGAEHRLECEIAHEGHYGKTIIETGRRAPPRMAIARGC
jgi:hypothetical protein